MGLCSRLFLVACSLGGFGMPLVSMAEVHCSAETLISICGSGRMELTLDEGAQTFRLRNGDVRCWGTDQQFSGTLVKQTDQGMGLGYFEQPVGVRVDHFNDSFIGEDRQDLPAVTPYLLGVLEYNPITDFAKIGREAKNGVAYLRIQEGLTGFRMHEYLLQCDR